MESPLWAPSDERVAKSQITAFRTFASAHANRTLETYEELLAWSIERPDEFWNVFASFSNMQFSCPAEVTLTSGKHMLDTTWFPGATLNFAENLLRHSGDKTAIVAWNEQGRYEELTFDELRDAVRRLASSLRQRGITKGDRVAAFMPNTPHAIVAMLATASIGAIWSSCSPDFGFKGVIDRFGQIEPKVLFATEGYYYNGKTIDCREKLQKIESAITSLESIIICPFTTADPDIASIDSGVLLPNLLAEAPDEPLSFEALPFDHPLYIMYSSGTTGKPKCIVHSAGGTLIQHLKEHILHTNVTEEDRVFYFSTCGWMMWNWHVSALATGATLLLYDGAPLYRDGKILFDLAQDEKMTVFGTSAKYLSAIEKKGLVPSKSHDLSSLRSILSTGSTLLPESFDYVYRDIKSDIHLASITGGTDIISCFILGNPAAPVFKGELQTKGLGMDVQILDTVGKQVFETRGELCCCSPFPSMPIYFWNDPDNARYRASYFERFDNIWCHGDWAEETANNGFIMYGRSDATLNPQGVRIGTAEIYRQVEQLDEVVESIVIGQQWEGDERVVLFLVLREGLVLDDTLIAKVKQQIRSNTTPRHVPAKVISVPAIPRTISGKIVELAVKNVVEGREITNKDALANPEALEHFQGIKELQ